MKNGLINENGVLIYYKDDTPIHAGAIKENGVIYYIGKGGVAVTGKHVVHREMANGLLKRGIYTFDEDGKLIEGSYIPPKKRKSHKRHKHRRKNGLKHLIKNFIRRKRRFDTKYNRKRVKIIFCTLMAVVILLGLTWGLDKMIRYVNIDNADQNDQKIELPIFENDVLLCSKAAQGIYSGEMTVAEALKYGSPYVPFVFEYNLKGSNGLLLISENANMSNTMDIFLSKSQTYVVIDNLKTGTAYFYEVLVDGEKYTGSFRTAPSTRFIKVDGIYNTRDIGGYTTLDNKYVKQGMIIRGTELDGLVELGYRLTEEGKKTIQSFGFVYDMDLRAESIFTGIYTSPLGADVRHKFYTAPQYGHIFSVAYKESLRQIFADLANPQNYPMYLHCTYGADRTGTIIFLLQGVLNMSEEEMIKEYQRTGFFSSSYADSKNMDIIISGLQNKSGDILQEKIVNFLIEDIGVTREEIESIRNILLQ